MRPNKPYRLYTDEQKSIALYLVEQKGESIKGAAKQVGCAFSTLKGWLYTARLNRKINHRG